MKRRNIVFKALTCGLASLAMTACTDTWNEHYQTKPELNATETLWDLIQADPELNQFEAYVKATGYDDDLSQNRFFTVWAPVDGSDFYTTHPLEGVSDSMINVYKLEFVENHIANYNHTASGMMTENRVKMLNGKNNPFEGEVNSYFFKGAFVKDANIAAKNGLLHKTEGHANFTANIWEQLAKVDSLSLINAFLKSFDEIIFDELNSIKGPIVGGQVTYLDSVIREDNEWFDRFGDISLEDSSYTMFAPTNKAWREMHTKAKTYFVYDNTNPQGDSLQDAMAKDFMCRFLVFRNTMQRSPEDSLTAYCYTNMTGGMTGRTQKKTFKDEELKNLYNNVLEEQELSNGTLFIVDSYNFPTTIWHDTVRVEGESLLSSVENPAIKTDEYAKCSKEYGSISKDSTAWYKQVSKGTVGVYAPLTRTGKPEVTFTFNNVLSAKYRVKVVFIPANYLNPRDTLLLPNKFKAELSYRTEKGKSTKISVGKELYNDPTRVDTLTLIPDDAAEGVDYFEFPCNEFNLDESATKFTQLKLTCTIGSKDEEHDRTFRIDQVFLEPVIE
ncbi:MAG: fasciclin domain-containing protein [Bacteroidaceae bacterium]|nr:fasciclin domain-containing protein [Bacteroidaceae bacterium]